MQASLQVHAFYMKYCRCCEACNCSKLHVAPLRSLPPAPQATFCDRTLPTNPLTEQAVAASGGAGTDAGVWQRQLRSPRWGLPGAVSSRGVVCFAGPRLSMPYGRSYSAPAAARLPVHSPRSHPGLHAKTLCQPALQAIPRWAMWRCAWWLATPMPTCWSGSTTI